MHTYSHGGFLVQSVDELPEPPEVIEELFLDVETSSRDEKLDALNPWHHCWVAGICVTWDDMKGAYYIPVGHANEDENLPRDAVIAWLKRVMERSMKWVNHNVKYDVHAVANDFGLDWIALSGGELVCTVVVAKVINSDRTFTDGYGLDALSRDWLGEDIGAYEAELFPYLENNKDYGRVPAFVMGRYGSNDPLTNRRLWHWEQANLPEESQPVIQTEIALTSLLVRMERTGMLVNPKELQVSYLYSLTRMLEIEKRLHAVVGYPFIPTSNTDCYDVLCNHYGLPVLAWTDDDDEEDEDVEYWEDESNRQRKRGNPSFNKKALAAYRSRIDAPVEVVDLMIEYRELSTFKGLFLKTYQKLAIPREDGLAVLHPNHNQALRTARMSVSKPNSQQLNGKAKALIKPGPGMSFMSADASQIEFRTIAHYTQARSIIEAYLADPDVDFHQRVADDAGTARRPAKTINFSVAFGQGKGATVSLLATDKDVVKSILDAIDRMVETGQLDPDKREAAFKVLATRKGEALYDHYHATYPEIRLTSKQAARVCQTRGYVRNIRGRRRYLPPDFAHKAFNTLNQSSAADIMKERMVALAVALDQAGVIKIVTQVHDEILMVGPTEVMEDHRTQLDIITVLEDVTCLRVPIRFKYGVSNETWKAAAGQDRSIPYAEVLANRARGQLFSHLS